MKPEPSRTTGSFEGAHNSMAGLLTAVDVAALLAVPVSWIYSETRAGRLPHVALGPRYRRYERHVIEAWWIEQRKGPSSYRKYSPSSAEPEGARDERS